MVFIESLVFFILVWVKIKRMLRANFIYQSWKREHGDKAVITGISYLLKPVGGKRGSE